MKTLTLITFLLLQINSTQAQGGNMNGVPGKSITIEKLQEMFDNIKKDTKWNITGDMLWGYFFTHNEPQLLEDVADQLENKGYRKVSIYLSEKDEQDDPDQFWLHIEKIETHTPESLDARNDEFYIFAHKHNIDSYDGMDVGPVEH